MKHVLKLFTIAVLTAVLPICSLSDEPGPRSAGAFRPPATPLVVHDPYFSVWSMSDNLTDLSTKHWTGTTQSLCGLVRVDRKSYRIIGNEPRTTPALAQTRHDVLPTHTVYGFEGAGIKLTLTFLNPAIPQDMELVSRPVTYVTWSVVSADGKSHDVQIYFDAGSELVVNIPEQRVVWGRYHVRNLQVLRMGSQEQPVLQKSGDSLRIDWGYLYLVSEPGKGVSESATVRAEATKLFMETGRVPDSDELEVDQPYGQPLPVLAECFDLGQVGSSPVARHVVLAYDDLYSVAFLQRELRPYWRRNGTEVGDLLQSALRDYDSLERRSTTLIRS